ncbi:MAG: SPFH domain-containing protein [Nanoarchaeota archaeon]
MAFAWIIYLIIVVFLASIKIVKQYERGVVFTFGKYVGMLEPGFRLILPVVQSWRRIDMRTTVNDVPQQDAMTKDNVSVVINAVLYFRVARPDLAVLEVEDYQYATSQLAQTSMRDVVGEVDLDQLLSKREVLSKRIREIVDKATDPWGIKVESVEIKDVELPSTLIRVIAKEAEAEREKRAVVIKAEGEFAAASNLVKAGKALATVKGGLHIRTLQTINNLGNEKSNTHVYAVPAELLGDIAKIVMKSR